MNGRGRIVSAVLAAACGGSGTTTVPSGPTATTSPAVGGTPTTVGGYTY